jgi:acetyl-CoA carboxylase carboxyl transferase subunit beta
LEANGVIGAAPRRELDRCLGGESFTAYLLAKTCFVDRMATIESQSRPKMPEPREAPTEPPKKRGVPEGLWLKCPGCGTSVYKKEVQQRLNVCPKCSHHFYVSAAERIQQVVDEGTFESMNEHLNPTDPLEFADRKPYADRLVSEQKRTGLSDAAVTGTGMIRARRVALAVTDSAFIMGSMGSVVGERLTRLVEHATKQNLPLIIISASGGGARMHEGILSLMQMAKVSAALARYDKAGGLFISVLTNPTMGGVAASFASLGDLVFAEPKALIGFAGPRTIKATIGIELPEGFQTSEFLLEHGYIDRIVERKNLKTEIARAIDYCGK